MAEQETIYAAAIRHKGRVCYMAPPSRHHDIIYNIAQNEGGFDQSSEQGFVTNDGRFVGREEAAKIAIEAGQIEQTKFQPGILFSEDLW